MEHVLIPLTLLVHAGKVHLDVVLNELPFEDPDNLMIAMMGRPDHGGDFVMCTHLVGVRPGAQQDVHQVMVTIVGRVLEHRVTAIVKVQVNTLLDTVKLLPEASWMGELSEQQFEQLHLSGVVVLPVLVGHFTLQLRKSLPQLILDGLDVLIVLVLEVAGDAGPPLQQHPHHLLRALVHGAAQGGDADVVLDVHIDVLGLQEQGHNLLHPLDHDILLFARHPVGA